MRRRKTAGKAAMPVRPSPEVGAAITRGPPRQKAATHTIAEGRAAGIGSIFHAFAQAARPLLAG